MIVNRNGRSSECGNNDKHQETKKRESLTKKPESLGTGYVRDLAL